MSGPSYAVFLVVAVGCHSRPLPLKPPAECSAPDVVACLQPLAFETLSSADLNRIREQAPACFSKDAATLRRQASCLPLVMGMEAQGRGNVEMRYHCSDLCPERGGVVAQLRGPRGVEACCSAGGNPLIDGFTRRFRGCAIRGSSVPSPLCEPAHRATP